MNIKRGKKLNSISFPNIFKSKANTTDVVRDKLDNSKSSMESTMECLNLLLNSEKGEMIGDPFYGIRLKKYIYDQNNYILRDILIDEIYTQIKLFCPQLSVNRNNIKIVSEKNIIKVKIEAINRVDFKTNMYELVLFNEEERI